MEPHLSHLHEVPPAADFRRTVELLRAYLRGTPGAYADLTQAAEQTPTTTSTLLALGVVLLDISAGAFGLPIEQMLDKVADSIQASHS